MFFFPHGYLVRFQNASASLVANRSYLELHVHVCRPSYSKLATHVAYCDVLDGEPQNQTAAGN